MLVCSWDEEIKSSHLLCQIAEDSLVRVSLYNKTEAKGEKTGT